jgi:hypothetical protein
VRGSRPRAECSLDRTDLDAIVERRRGAVCLHVADRRITRIVQRGDHRARRTVAIGLRRRQVVRIEATPDTRELDLRITALRREHEHRGALADDEPVAMRIERARDAARRQDAE